MVAAYCHAVEECRRQGSSCVLMVISIEGPGAETKDRVDEEKNTRRVLHTRVAYHRPEKR